MACNVLKKGPFHLFVHPKWSTIIFRNTHFWPIFDPFFLSQSSPFSRHFVTLEWPKWLVMGSKWGHFTCLSTPNGLQSFLKNTSLTHF